MFITDVNSLGQDVCQGVLTNSFYWDLSRQARAWTNAMWR